MSRTFVGFRTCPEPRFRLNTAIMLMWCTIRIRAFGVEWSNPKLRPILDWSAEFSLQSGVQSRVQSKTPAYFGFGVRIALQKFRSAKCPVYRVGHGRWSWTWVGSTLILGIPLPVPYFLDCWNLGKMGCGAGQDDGTFKLNSTQPLAPP